ncbi:peptidoglycan D,D-transpeptidase FtsI family protein [Aeromicrobium fastidiosum]|uniref:Penicillin-binding protein 2 n=1 Tax=Aeromicrobium fastidiosum TaxID=52699 RepID=A0A641AN23_9ACTN|nr:penicillin-binding protein 2 [Aeromicrobium fastidiosum]KAA1378674.1 penicillin-binding protein 2 [Aeromicrobium fastidiosum]MBP2392340.1 cell division protein FtsI (penicillin-binding protein 3) [Aeromicrobium fastidiosum]
MTERVILTRRRLRLCTIFVFVVFGVFGARLFQIQGIDSSAYAAASIAAGTQPKTEPAPRGNILDRNGAQLATSVAGLTITADPSMTAENAPQIARILREKLGDDVDYFDTIDKLRTPDSRFVYLVRDVPKWTADKALDALSDAKLTGVFAQKGNIRTYPGGSLAANLLGYVNGAGKGVAGLEQQYDKTLTGTDGSSTYEVSPTGQRIPMADSRITKMVPGEDVKTTIDRDLQWYADQRLTDAVRSSSSDWGLAITMDVKTCQIVQMSQAPTFDADTRTGMDDSNTVSRAVQNVYEPGSVMKTVTMAALADQGKIAADTPISVPSSLTIDKFRIGDYWEHGNIKLTAAGVIALSSNLGTIVASQQMSDQTMYDYFSKFGFGQKSGVDLPGESNGILTDGKSWTKANHATISFGQGISVTAMQMMRAVGAIANAGTMCEPTVVSSTIDHDGKESPVASTPGRRVVSKDAAATVTRMMEAVTADDGTAPAAQIEGYRVAGKTGTAWRVDPATGRYIRGQNTVSFMGFAPADNPRFLTYIVLDKPYSNAGGGSTAAPVFHDIMSMALERFGVAPSGSKSPKVEQTW